MNVRPTPKGAVGFRLLAAAAVVATATTLVGCPAGKCFFRVKHLDAKGNVTSSKCLVDSCPKGAQFNEAKNGCECNAPLVTLAGACVTVAQAAASCGQGFAYANGGCVAQVCPAGQVFDAQTGACAGKKETDSIIAAAAGVVVGQNQELGCPAGFTPVYNGKDMACVPKEATCGTGTKWDGSTCAPISCAAGTVLDAATGQCTALATTDDKSAFSVQAKLTSALGPDFCAPHVKNPGGFNVQPGQAITVKVAVRVTVPGNMIEQAQVASIKVTGANGADLSPAVYSGVNNINKQVNEQVLGGIRALGGKSTDAEANAEVSCTIKRAAIIAVPIPTSGGGI